MTPTLTPLEPHAAPVGLLFDWTDAAPLVPFRPAVESAAVAFAARLTPAVPTPDPMTVYVGTTHTPGTLGQGGPRDGGGLTLLLNPAADWGTFDLGSVVRHEVLHGVGVLDHSPDPDALLHYTMQPHRVKDATATDRKLAAAAGWDIGPPEFPAEGVVVENPYGQVGWARLTPEQAAGWWRAGNLK